MAQPKMFAEVVIAGSYKNLAKSTRGASKELKGFEKTAKKISGAVKGALAGIAVAGVTMLTDAIIDMGKAAAEDRKSMALLNKTMQNSWGETETLTSGVEDYIEKTSNMSGIMDDDLRPAFAKIVRVTKTSAKAQSAFNRVMDIAAGTGKDVNLVAQAYSKYLGGNKTALDKLIPGLKDAGDKIGFIDEKYSGLAEVAGSNDPFAKINVVLENFKEKIGTAFLPLIDKIADWLAGDDAQKAMDDFADAVGTMFAYFASPEGQKGMDNFLDKTLDIADGITTMMENFDKAKPLIDFLMWTTENLNPSVWIAKGIDAMTGNNFNLNGTKKEAAPTGPNNSFGSTVYNIYGVTSGNDVVKALKNEANKKGRTVLGLITG